VQHQAKKEGRPKDTETGEMTRWGTDREAGEISQKKPTRINWNLYVGLFPRWQKGRGVRHRGEEEEAQKFTIFPNLDETGNSQREKIVGEKARCIPRGQTKKRDSIQVRKKRRENLHQAAGGQSRVQQRFGENQGKERDLKQKRESHLKGKNTKKKR